MLTSAFGAQIKKTKKKNLTSKTSFLHV